jgi:hypothetical protein
VAGCCERGNERSRSAKCAVFPGHRANSQTHYIRQWRSIWQSISNLIIWIRFYFKTRANELQLRWKSRHFFLKTSFRNRKQTIQSVRYGTWHTASCNCQQSLPSTAHSSQAACSARHPKRHVITAEAFRHWEQLPSVTAHDAIILHHACWWNKLLPGQKREGKLMSLGIIYKI